MHDNEKIYRIELTNEEYEFLENLKTEFCNKLLKMSNEEITEYLKILMLLLSMKKLGILFKGLEMVKEELLKQAK